MIKSKTSRCLGTAGLLGALAFTACEPGQPYVVKNGSENFGQTVKPDVTQVHGYTWDPEASLYLAATSGIKCEREKNTSPDCPIIPMSFGMPGLTTAAPYAVLPGIEVSLFDPLNPAGPGLKGEPAGTNGAWRVDVPSRSDVPYFAIANAPPGAPQLNPPPAGYDALPPGAEYLTTMDLKPIVPYPTLCMSQPATMLTDHGILGAVARHLSATGSSTTVRDLLNKTRYGGVLVVWQLAPGPGGVHAPGAGTRTLSDKGQVFHIDFIPPSIPLPEPVDALRSERGFIVATKTPDPEDPPGPPELADSSAIGVTVVLAPPNSGDPVPLNLKLEDADPTRLKDGTQWVYPQLPPTPVAPGMVTFVEMPAIVDAKGLFVPDFVCIPK